MLNRYASHVWSSPHSSCEPRSASWQRLRTWIVDWRARTFGLSWRQLWVRWWNRLSCRVVYQGFGLCQNLAGSWTNGIWHSGLGCQVALQETRHLKLRHEYLGYEVWSFPNVHDTCSGWSRTAPVKVIKVGIKFQEEWSLEIWIGQCVPFHRSRLPGTFGSTRTIHRAFSSTPEHLISSTGRQRGIF